MKDDILSPQFKLAPLHLAYCIKASLFGQACSSQILRRVRQAPLRAGENQITANTKITMLSITVVQFPCPFLLWPTLSAQSLHSCPNSWYLTLSLVKTQCPPGSQFFRPPALVLDPSQSTQFRACPCGAKYVHNICSDL